MEYDGAGFLEKNRDSLPGGANELMQVSKSPLIRYSISIGIVGVNVCTYVRTSVFGPPYCLNIIMMSTRETAHPSCCNINEFS